MPPVREWVAERVRGRIWWLRAPVLLLLLWILRGYLGGAAHASIFDGVTLAFHEMGHAAFSRGFEIPPFDVSKPRRKHRATLTQTRMDAFNRQPGSRPTAFERHCLSARPRENPTG